MSQQSEEGWSMFVKLCTNAPSETILRQLFDLLLSHEEKKQLSARCLIVRALMEKQMPQREIAAELGLSISQITRGSNELKRIDAELHNYLKTQLRLQS